MLGGAHYEGLSKPQNYLKPLGRVVIQRTLAWQWTWIYNFPKGSKQTFNRPFLLHTYPECTLTISPL